LKFKEKVDFTFKLRKGKKLPSGQKKKSEQRSPEAKNRQNKPKRQHISRGEGNFQKKKKKNIRFPVPRTFA